MFSLVLEASSAVFKQCQCVTFLCRREIKPCNTEKHPARFFFRLSGDSQEPRGSPDTQAQPSLLIHMAHYVVPFKKKKGICPTEPGT